MSYVPNDPTTHDAIDSVWRAQRRRLVDIGYRMLGSVSEAEDLADEAYARLLVADIDAITDPTGWLITVTSRLCFDRLRSADQRRRAYVGPWLPEPLLANRDPHAVDPADRVTLDDSIRLALLVVLEQLSPAERTAFVLHDLFSVEFEQVGEIVGRSPAACRQLASRARRRIQSDPETPRAVVDRAELERVAHRFADACASGAIGPLLEVLDPDVVGDFDSGGLIAGAPLDALDGAEPIARTLAWAFRDPRFTFDVDDLNGEPGVIARLGTRIVAVIAIGVHQGRVDLIHAIGNPRKLRNLNRTGRGRHTRSPHDRRSLRSRVGENEMTASERLDMPLGEAIYSLRAIRRHRPDPIPDDDIRAILDAAIQAPNGGNMQPWHFLVVTDADLRAAFAPLYREAWWAKRNDSGWFTPEDLPDEYRSPMRLADEIGTSPVLIFVCALAKGAAAANSIVPAVQNLLLAARGLGIGGTITTLHPSIDDRVHDLFGIPETAQVVYCLPLGYPRGAFGPVSRKPLDQVISFNSW